MTLRADGEEDPDNPVGDGKVREPPRPRRYRWADGKMHDSPAPSSETIKVPLPESTLGLGDVPQDGAPLTRYESKPARPDVPKDFIHTPRTLLRQTAMDFVLRAATLNARDRYSVVSGADLMREAEELEKWLASP